MQLKQLIGYLMAATFAAGAYAQSGTSGSDMGGAAGTPSGAAGADSSTMGTTPSQDSVSAPGSSSSSGAWGQSSDTASSMSGSVGYDTNASSQAYEPRGSQLPGPVGDGEATRTPEFYQ
ncbi:MAG TPA: hypothetical protein VNO84_09740 [Burkholderiaceae bacterium]|nr:hypothetical protein [Burkholderiaceae bacterium]